MLDVVAGFELPKMWSEEDEEVLEWWAGLDGARCHTPAVLRKILVTGCGQDDCGFEDPAAAGKRLRWEVVAKGVAPAAAAVVDVVESLTAVQVGGEDDEQGIHCFLRKLATLGCLIANSQSAQVKPATCSFDLLI